MADEVKKKRGRPNIDLTGQKFGRLTVLRRTDRKNKAGSTYYWLCRCTCGAEKEIISASLRNGTTQSCGCLHKEIVTKIYRKKGLGIFDSKHHGKKNKDTEPIDDQDLIDLQHRGIPCGDPFSF